MCDHGIDLCNLHDGSSKERRIIHERHILLKKPLKKKPELGYGETFPRRNIYKYAFLSPVLDMHEEMLMNLFSNASLLKNQIMSVCKVNPDLCTFHWLCEVTSTKTQKVIKTPKYQRHGFQTL